MKRIMSLLLLVALNLLFSQDFTNISAGLTGVNNGNADWGDYDNDGDLDVFVSGETGSVYISKIYRNTNGVFADINAGLTGAVIGSSAWGDYDNDGDLDIVIVGSDGTVRATKIYQNNNGSFTDLNAGLQGVWYSSVAWGDYDNDGDLDILLTGVEGSTYYSIIYRNENGSFTDINAGLQGVYNGSCAWIDYDKDGDLDVFISGASAAGDISRIYRNDLGVFTNISAGLQGVHYSSADWGDYDSDSDPDIILTGSYNSVSYTIIYRNDAGIFTNISAGLQGVWQGSADWGDYDNDGDPDVVLTGTNASILYSKIYRNDTGSFSDINAPLTTVSGGSSEWGDYDNDGDLDLLISGSSGTGYKTIIYRNNSGVLNTPPNVPTALLATVTGYDAVLSWNKTTDAQTLQNGLSYNVYISSVPGTCDIKSPMSSISTGFRKIVAIGNANQKRQWTIKGLSPGTYYWSVQAIDHAFAGSAFAAEGSFFTAPETPVATEATNVTTNGFRTNWNTVANADSYTITVWDEISYSEEHFTTNNWYDFYGLQPNKIYHYYVMASNSSGNSPTSNTFTVNTLPYFTEISAGLTEVYSGSTAWGDYDNDGDLDIFISGYSPSSGRVSKIYRNDGSGAFTDINASFSGVENSSVSWGDFDNDGDLDIFIAGYNDANHYTGIIKNEGNDNFSTITFPSGLSSGSSDWGDFDNDGDLDILQTGTNGGSIVSRILRNNGSSSFTDIGAGLTGVINSSVDWGDYDNDGDLDILLTGYTGGSDYKSNIYRNNGNSTFTDIGAGLQGLGYSSVEWGDYDNDGNIDILITGYNGSTGYSKIYRNNAGTFTEQFVLSAGVYSGSSSWGDYDNDGYLDILLTGMTGTSTRTTKIYRSNYGLSFTEINESLPGIGQSSVAWGDYDNDGDLDILLTGGGSEVISKIYRNDSPIANTPPATPENLSSTGTGFSATLSWNKSTDNQTYQSGLSYNVYISSVSGSCNTKPPMSNISTGYRKVVASGNIGQNISWAVKDLLPGTYYWSVQAIDNAFAGSAFASEGSFYTAPAAPVAEEAAEITIDGFKANWNFVENADDYQVTVWDLYGYAETHHTTNNWYEFTGLQANKTYYYDVIASNSSGPAASNIVTFDTLPYFSDAEAGLPGVDYSSVAWGDYDNDNDLDILLTGNSESGGITRIYRNDSGSFSSYISLDGILYSSVAWGDYDNDGDLDVLMSGYIYSGYISKIYRNNGNNTFTDMQIGLPGVTSSSVVWGDYDNDGDLDIFLAGFNGSGAISKIYRNNGNNMFTDIEAGLIGISNGSAAWGDYDNDSDLDILMTGDFASRIYRNDSGLFTDINAGIPRVTYSSVAWGDYDNDGDLDILMTGFNSSGVQISNIYRNDSGLFTDINAGLPGISYGSAAWGDYDNDGDLDILMTGDNNLIFLSKIFRNDSGSFADINAGLPVILNSCVAWGDYDNDGDLDILLTGQSLLYQISKIYRNNSQVQNTPPSKPSKLITALNGDSLKLSYNPSSDSQTPQAGLSYNVEINLNGQSLKPSMSDISNGYRKIPSIGNTSQNLSWDLNNFITYLPQCVKVLSWKVQAVDHCFAGSGFSSSPQFDFSGRDLEVYSKTDMIETDFLKWEYAYPEYVDYYVLQIDNDPAFGSPIEENITLEKLLSVSNTKTMYITKVLNTLTGYAGLENNTEYFWRIKPVYSGNNESVFNSTPLSFIFNPSGTAPNPPVSGFNPANDDIESSLPKLSWNNAVDPDGHAEDLYYICQLDTINTFTSVQYADTTDAGITSVQVASVLPEGYRYYYRVKTVDADALQSVWSAVQTFLIVMPPQYVKITDDGTNVNLTWDAIPVNTKGVVYTVYSSANPYAEFPAGWTVAAAQLTANSWAEPHSAAKKFYRITAGSSSK